MIIRPTYCQALLIAAMALTIAGSNSCGQSVVAEQSIEETPASEFTNVGVKECAACHSTPSPIYQNLQVTSFVRLDEAKHWLEYDKHSIAYEILTQDNPLTAEICRKLNWHPSGTEFVRNCLTCHAGIDHRQPTPDETSLRFGVQCEACHGAASEWTKVEHHQQTSWREKTPNEKLQLGMKDLVSPSTCAEVCFGCHIGDIKQNRFVTHAMYAAGHPPLPPVELQTFLDAMPPHWKTLADKPLPPSASVSAPHQFEKQNEYYQAHFGTAALNPDVQSAIRNSYHRSQTSLIGGLVAYKVGLKLIRDAAEVETRWGDYALYDCAGCHHELHKPTKRSLPVGRTPGRPQPANWWRLNTSALSTQNVSPHLATSIILDAYDKTPFGSREAVGDALRSVFLDQCKWTDAWHKAERKPFTEAQVLAWLRTIIESRMSSMADFWTARQTGWMVEVAVNELLSRGRMAKEPTQQLLAELSRQLQLTIAKPPKQLVVEDLRATLDRARTFDPVRCQQILVELLNLAGK